MQSRFETEKEQNRERKEEHKESHEKPEKMDRKELFPLQQVKPQRDLRQNVSSEVPYGPAGLCPNCNLCTNYS